MDFAIIVLIITNIVTNLYLIHTLENQKPIVIEPQWEGITVRVELPTEEPKVEEPSVVVDNEKYKAWKNVTYEPVKAPPSPHGPPPIPGPLQRPSGFAL